jgi:hypothetical protein
MHLPSCCPPSLKSVKLASIYPVSEVMDVRGPHHAGIGLSPHVVCHTHIGVSPAGGSPLTTYAMKADAVPCTPSLLLDPQQQSISAGSTESESNESGDEDCAGA